MSSEIPLPLSHVRFPSPPSSVKLDPAKKLFNGEPQCMAMKGSVKFQYTTPVRLILSRAQGPQPGQRKQQTSFVLLLPPQLKHEAQSTRHNPKDVGCNIRLRSFSRSKRDDLIVPWVKRISGGHEIGCISWRAVRVRARNTFKVSRETNIRANMIITSATLISYSVSSSCRVVLSIYHWSASNRRLLQSK